MSVDKIKSVLTFEIPNPPLPGPTQHKAVEKNRDKEGGFAQTLAERFPFGMIVDEDPNQLRYKWGIEDFSFLQDMLQTNELRHELYMDWSTRLEKEKRLYYRQVRKDIEEQWFYFLQDHHRFLLDVREKRDIEIHKWAKQLLIDRVGQRFFDNREFFINQIINAQELRKDQRRHFDMKVRSNPYDNRLKWPSKPSLFAIESEKAGLKEDLVWEERDKYHKNEDMFVEAYENKLMALTELHQRHYGHLEKYEKVLVDLRPGMAEYGWRQTTKMRIGKLKGGVPPAKKVQNQ